MQSSRTKTLDLLLEQVSQMQQQLAQMQQEQVEDRIILKNLQKHLPTSTVLSPNDFPQRKKNSLSYQVAKNVSSVVGLKEAITWKSNFLKCVWTIAICAGVAATAYFVFAAWDEYKNNPTATRTEIIKKENYSYPAIILCPTDWLDADKALSIGLSLEGLKYSLGYVSTNADKTEPDNATIGRKNFYDFYDRNNFTSFDDYLIDISLDVLLEQSYQKYFDSISTVAYCSRCNSSYLRKVVTHLGVCYNFQMMPETAVGQLSSVARLIAMQINGRSSGLVNRSLWNLYVGSENKDLNLKRPVVPRMMVKPFTFTTVRFHQQKHHLLSKANFPCLSKKDPRIVSGNYSSTSCIAECLTPLYTRAYNCTPMEKIVGRTKQHPSQLCNVFDNPDASMGDEWADSESDIILNSDDAKKCYEKYPHSCDRTRIETVQEGEHKDTDFSIGTVNFIAKAPLLNITFVDVYIENAALYQGGILTLSEINTISFTSLVSNVGGTLGLFVGATMMTFVQIVMFIIKFFFEKRKSLAASEHTDSTK